MYMSSFLYFLVGGIWYFEDTRGRLTDYETASSACNTISSSNLYLHVSMYPERYSDIYICR